MPLRREFLDLHRRIEASRASGRSLPRDGQIMRRFDEVNPRLREIALALAERCRFR